MRDPRWGRAQEVPGECPKLTAEYAAHLIGGAQRGNATTSQDQDPRFWLSAVTAKHFTMYDMEGYMPRTPMEARAAIPGVPSATADTSGGVQRWNFE
jgi:beta-glucosidase-like glycosyl hydrolase